MRVFAAPSMPIARCAAIDFWNIRSENPPNMGPRRYRTPGDSKSHRTRSSSPKGLDQNTRRDHDPRLSGTTSLPLAALKPSAAIRSHLIAEPRPPASCTGLLLRWRRRPCFPLGQLADMRTAAPADALNCQMRFCSASTDPRGQDIGPSKLTLSSDSSHATGSL
jgi:hypothetical protein